MSNKSLVKRTTWGAIGDEVVGLLQDVRSTLPKYNATADTVSKNSNTIVLIGIVILVVILIGRD